MFYFDKKGPLFLKPKILKGLYVKDCYEKWGDEFVDYLDEMMFNGTYHTRIVIMDIKEMLKIEKNEF